MREISVFDVIGPNMIGPSSSHTAGALRIALLARKIPTARIASVEFILYGSFARTYRGHGTDRALVAGILGMGTEDIRIRDSFDIAGREGLKFSFTTNMEVEDVFPNTVDIVLTDEQGAKTAVTGESVGGGEVSIRRINGVEVSLSGKYHTLLVRQTDLPGVVAHITRCLCDAHINIAFLRMYREANGKNAYTIIEADEPIGREVVAQVGSHAHVHSAVYIPK